MLLPPSLERTTRRWQHSSLKQERVMSRPARTRNPGTNMHDTLQRSVRVRQNRLNTIIIIMTVTCMASARSRPDEAACSAKVETPLSKQQGAGIVCSIDISLSTGAHCAGGRTKGKPVGQGRLEGGAASHNGKQHQDRESDNSEHHLPPPPQNDRRQNGGPFRI